MDLLHPEYPIEHQLRWMSKQPRRLWPQIGVAAPGNVPRVWNSVCSFDQVLETALVLARCCFGRLARGHVDGDHERAPYIAGRCKVRNVDGFNLSGRAIGIAEIRRERYARSS